MRCSMSKRSITIIITLLVAIIALATALDLVGMRREFPRFWMDLPPHTNAVSARIHEDVMPLFQARMALPRTVRALATLGALAGLGLLLGYLLPRRFTTLTRALGARPGLLARYALQGLAVLILMLALIVLAAISLIVALLVPVFGIGLGFTLLIGMVALARAGGQHIRTRLGALDPSPTADLLTGLMVLVLLSLFPYAGPLVLIGAGLMGLGAVVATRFGMSVGTLEERRLCES